MNTNNLPASPKLSDDEDPTVIPSAQPSTSNAPEFSFNIDDENTTQVQQTRQNRVSTAVFSKLKQARSRLSKLYTTEHNLVKQIQSLKHCLEKGKVPNKLRISKKALLPGKQPTQEFINKWQELEIHCGLKFVEILYKYLPVHLHHHRQETTDFTNSVFEELEKLDTEEKKLAKKILSKFIEAAKRSSKEKPPKRNH